MNARQFTSKLNKVYKTDNQFSMTDDGYRIRVTAECKAMGDEYVEIGATYFYKIQGNPEFMAKTAETYIPEVKLEAVSTKRYNDRPWPKDSWATQIYKVVCNDINQAPQA